MILDVVIEAGNPADSERFLPMLERHIAFYGEAPRQGGFATRHNLSQAKARKRVEAAFPVQIRCRPHRSAPILANLKAFLAQDRSAELFSSKPGARRLPRIWPDEHGRRVKPRKVRSIELGCGFRSAR